MKITKSQLKQILQEELQRVIKESSYHTVNAQLDQLEDIVATGVEKQQDLEAIAAALQGEGFRDASVVDEGALTFTGDDGELYGVALPGRVDLAGDVTAREIGPYVLGVIGGDEEDDEDPRGNLGGMVDVDYDDPIVGRRGNLEERKITKAQLHEIIKQELSEALPPHLQSKVDAYEKKKQRYSITDVTPPGYGPDEEDYAGEESDDDVDYEAGLNEPHEYDQVAALNLGTPEEDPMKRTRRGRGQASRLRKTVMNK